MTIARRPSCLDRAKSGRVQAMSCARAACKAYELTHPDEPWSALAADSGAAWESFSRYFDSAYCFLTRAQSDTNAL